MSGCSNLKGFFKFRFDVKCCIWSGMELQNEGPVYVSPVCWIVLDE